MLILKSFLLLGIGTGTASDPILIDQFPYVKADTTTNGHSVFNDYSCSDTNESGPEMIYRFSITEPGNLTGWVVGDEGAVDIDIYLLSSLNISNGTGSDCIVRNNRHFEQQNLQPGDYYIVVDSFVDNGVAGDGPYELYLDFVPYDIFVDRIIGKGVIWRRKIYPLLFDQRQSVNIIKIDPKESTVVLKPIAATGCETVASMGARVGATAVINAGFFDTSNCASVSYMKIDGVQTVPGMYATGFGVNAFGVPALKKTNGSWDEIHQAIGGGPRLLDHNIPGVTDTEVFDAGFINYRHPRSGACYNSESGEIQFLTVDGRTDAGGGINLPDLGQYMAWLSCNYGVNYDGGGSTSMWVSGQPFNGIVNYPSDNKTADHIGARRVSSGWGVFAQPYNYPPRFQTEPVITVLEGESYYYDADALDLNPYDQLTFQLITSPAGMVVNRSGEVSWDTAPGTYSIVLEVSDGENRVTQSYTLVVPGEVDLCDPNPCIEPHKTICSSSNNSALCSCESGYELSNGNCIEIIVDPCTPNPCNQSHQSICSSSNGIATCLCESGYELSNGNCVEMMIDPCDEKSCGDTFVCRVIGDVANCICPVGKIEENGVCVYSETNPCDPNPCTERNKTTCRVSGLDALCFCDEGYVEDSGSCILKSDPDPDPSDGVSSDSSGCDFGTGDKSYFLVFGILVLLVFRKRIGFPQSRV